MNGSCLFYVVVFILVMGWFEIFLNVIKEIFYNFFVVFGINCDWLKLFFLVGEISLKSKVIVVVNIWIFLVCDFID